MKENQIQEFYDEVLKGEIAKGFLYDKVSKIQTEEELRKFIRVEILPLAKENGYDFTEDDVMQYEKSNVQISQDGKQKASVINSVSKTLLFSTPLMILFSLFVAGNVNSNGHSESVLAESESQSVSCVDETASTNPSEDIEKYAKTLSVLTSSLRVTQPEVKALKAANSGGQLYENGVAIYPNIMRRAAEKNALFANEKIVNIAMLGAHDACTYKINKNSKVSFSTTPVLENKFLALLGKRMAVNYAKAQSEDVYTLLKRGARMLDVRISHESGGWYTTHSVISGEFDESLKDTIRFLLDNPGEFVVFHIGGFASEYNEGTIAVAKHISEVKVKRGNKEYNLYDFVNYDAKNEKLSDLTYNKVTANGTKGGVYISLPDKMGGIQENTVCPTKNVQYKYLIRHESVAEKWLNAQTTEQIMNGMTEVCKDSFKTYPNRFRMCQYQTSPDTKEIILRGFFLNKSLLKNAEEHNIKVVNDPRFEQNMKLCPIAWFDNISTTKGNFNEIVNNKILKYNSNLGKTVSTTSIKYNKTTNLKNNMKIVLTEGNKLYFGDSIKGKVGEIKNGTIASANDKEWTLEQSGDKWKIKLSNGSYLKRRGTSIIPKLGTTTDKNSSTSFTVTKSNGGFKFTDGGKYSLVISNSSLEFKRGGGKATTVSLYARA